MKKLMIVAAAVLSAGLVQAGAVNWGSGTFYTAGKDGAFTTTKVQDGGVTVNGSCWVLDQAAWQAFYDIYTQDGYAAMSKAIYDTYTAAEAPTPTKTGATSSTGSTITFASATSADNKSYVYAAVLYTMTQDGQDYYLANLGDWAAMSSQSTQAQMATNELGQRKTTSGYQNHGTTLAITGWSTAAIPEPTSGLLLLLGVAGLALRRRRA